MTDTDEEKSGNGKTFDMYHFFSRWDVWLVIIVVLALLIFAVMSNFFGSSHAGAT